jgi:hypothetical protein
MCPACMASAALMAGSVMSSGGIAALAVKMVRAKNSEKMDGSKIAIERRNENGDDDKQDGAGNAGGTAI